MTTNTAQRALVLNIAFNNKRVTNENTEWDSNYDAGLRLAQYTAKQYVLDVNSQSYDGIGNKNIIEVHKTWLKNDQQYAAIISTSGVADKIKFSEHPD